MLIKTNCDSFNASVCEKCGALVDTYYWQKHIEVMHPSQSTKSQPPKNECVKCQEAPDKAKDDWLIPTPEWSNFDCSSAVAEGYILAKKKQRAYIAKRLYEAWNDPGSNRLRDAFHSLFRAAGLEK